MRYEELFIAGLGSHLAPPVPVDEALASGRYEQEEQDESGQEAVRVAGDDEPQPLMAVNAGRSALRRSGVSPRDVGLLLHAVTGHNGVEGWNAASYVQHEVLGSTDTLALEIRQLSNGGMAGIDLAAFCLASSPGYDAALITSADRFAEPAYDRWRTSWGLVFGDGAGAAVLSRTEGFARLLSCVTASAPELEGMHRGGLPFRPAPDPRDHPVDFRSRTVLFAAEYGLDEIARLMSEGIRSAFTAALEEAGVGRADIDHLVLPGFGLTLLNREVLEPLGLPLERTTYEWHRQVGHLGASDQFASFTHLAESGRLRAGDTVAMVGVGGGFNWTCAVARVRHAPGWTP
ncbi:MULTISPECIES: ketoacyl-ACP synthase III family protein [unclassified Nocardiopsis]|uniref:ketoacyl-ACP synthase III family protein n=1 Tax=Nocardiopsis TaxID=2013 RepID=UPI00387B62B6